MPPLEGPERRAYIGKAEDFRQDPEYQLPTPDKVPAATGDDPVFDMPSEPDCPDGWKLYQRIPEGFEMCYPPDWTLGTDAYKNAPNEARWYAGGIFDFSDAEHAHQLAHVSVYVIPQFTRPFPYTKDCPTPFSMKLNDQPAVVCPSFPAVSPEARIISYHVYRENRDYFFNIATYYKWDEGKDKLTSDTDEGALDTAIKIIRSTKFLPIPVTNTPAAGSPTP